MRELFTKGPLDPVRRLGGTVVILGPNGLLGSPASGAPTGQGSTPQVYQVTGVEKIPPLGQHGFLGLYANGAAALAGYTLDGSAKTNVALGIGGNVQVSPTALNLFPGILAQVRFRIAYVGALPAPPVIDDFDYTLNTPAAVGSGYLQGVQGVYNARFQPPLIGAGDTGILPAQGANLADPTLYPFLEWTDAAWQSEFFVGTQQPPQFTITNQGSAAIPQGTSGATTVMLGILMAGLRYNITPWTGPGETVRMGGQTFQAPKDTVIIPITAVPPATS